MSKKNEIVLSERNRIAQMYFAAEAKAEDSLWKFAATVYKLVNSEKFKNGYRNLEDFAKEVGRTKGSISQLISAVETRDRLLETTGDTECKTVIFCDDASVTQMRALSGVDPEVIHRAIEDGTISQINASREIEAFAKAHKPVKARKQAREESKTNIKVTVAAGDDEEVYELNLTDKQCTALMVYLDKLAQ